MVKLKEGFSSHFSAEFKTYLCAVMDDVKHHALTVCSGFSRRNRALVNKAYKKGLLSVHE